MEIRGFFHLYVCMVFSCPEMSRPVAALKRICVYKILYIYGDVAYMCIKIYVYLYGYKAATERIFWLKRSRGHDKPTAIARGVLAAICHDLRLMIVP